MCVRAFGRSGRPAASTFSLTFLPALAACTSHRSTMTSQGPRCGRSRCVPTNGPMTNRYKRQCDPSPFLIRNPFTVTNAPTIWGVNYLDLEYTNICSPSLLLGCFRRSCFPTVVSVSYNCHWIAEASPDGDGMSFFFGVVMRQTKSRGEPKIQGR